MRGNFLTKGVTLLLLVAVAVLGVGIAGLFIPAPYHYAGILFPFVVLYLLGSLASKISNK
jgi:hypothetical protein